MNTPLYTLSDLAIEHEGNINFPVYAVDVAD